MAVTESGPGSPAVLIVGRDAPFCRRLASQVKSLGRRMPLRVLAPACGADEALRVQERPAVALLDLGLQDASGYALARRWEHCPGLELVLILPSLDSRPQARRLRAADMLWPPVRLERLEQALRRALRANGPDQTALPVAAWGHAGAVALPVEALVYARAHGKYVALRTREGEFLTDRSLAELMRAYPDRFIQVHRNALAARAAIAGANRVTPELNGGDADPYWELLLQGVPERIAVARRRWPMVRRCVPAAASFPPTHPEAI